MGGAGRGPPLTAALAALLAGPAETAARALLGARVSANGVTVALTEVEAYGGESDPPSHAYRGQTARNAVMFGPAGRAYVYFTYGMHWCLNVVTGPAGVAGGVLLRAGEVVEGVPAARARRPAARVDRDLARGPARLCAALAVDGAASGVDLLDPAAPVRLTAAPAPPDEVRAGPRVGVSTGADVPWRFWIAGAPTVSAYRRGGRPRKR